MTAGPGGTVVADAPALLRGSGLRVTDQRVAVLEVLRGAPHADADDVVRAVRERLGRVSVQAVYDALAALGRARLVRRIEPAGSPARFELRVGDNHHHLVCRSCGEVRDADCAVGAAPCLVPAATGAGGAGDGFVVDEAEVIYWGTCATCLRPALPAVATA